MLHEKPMDIPQSESKDVEIGETPTPPSSNAPRKSAYQSLGWLDKLLALWILLAIIVGILIGNYVDGAGEVLQKGKFVDVSVPVG